MIVLVWQVLLSTNHNYDNNIALVFNTYPDMFFCFFFFLFILSSF